MKMINTALSGLNASMAALQTLTNNTTNAMVPGYSRQQVVMSSVGGGSHGEGAGVRVDSVRRISDQYQVAQVWRSNSEMGFATIKNSYLSNLEQVFSAEGNNLSTGLDHFFAALNSAQEQPNDIAYREAILNAADGMAVRFNSIADGINAQQHQIQGQMTSSVTEVNTLLQKIAGFNKQISESNTSSTPPADMLDGRDDAIGKLAKLLDIRTVTDSRGLVNVSLAQGQPLVSGSTSAKLVSESGTTTATGKVATGTTQVGIQFGDAKFPLGGNAGGSLGALIDYRDHNLAKAKTFLDEEVKNLADTVNAVLANGKDLSGKKVTEPLFSYHAADPSNSIKVNKNLKPEMLALSLDGTPGDNSNLKELIKIADKPFAFTDLGNNASLGDAFASKVGELGSTARQAIMNKKTATAMQKEANKQWAATSGVNMNEEGGNLIMYLQAYQSNAKVIATADQLFQSLIHSF